MALADCDLVVDIEWNRLGTRYVSQSTEPAKSPPMSLPDGFPEHLPDEIAWHGSRLGDETKYTYHLTNQDSLEVESALAAFKSKQLAPKSENALRG